MNKTEIQSLIERAESHGAYLQREHDAIKSKIASLKAELTKCDCTDGIEQEKCWYAASDMDSERPPCLFSSTGRTKKRVEERYTNRAAYMPECRQVSAEDALLAGDAYLKTRNKEHLARELHKLGFRMKVTP